MSETSETNKDLLLRVEEAETAAAEAETEARNNFDRLQYLEPKCAELQKEVDRLRKLILYIYGKSFYDAPPK